MAKFVERPVATNRFKHVKLTVNTKELVKGDPDFDKFQDEMDKSDYSITPTTLKSREFFKDYATASAVLDTKYPSKRESRTASEPDSEFEGAGSGINNSSRSAAALSSPELLKEDDDAATKPGITHKSEDGDVTTSGRVGGALPKPDLSEKGSSGGGAVATPDASSIDPVFYQDTYSYEKNSVVRFGFNVHSEDMKAGIDVYNTSVSSIKLDLRSLASSNSKGSKSKKKDSSKESSLSAEKTPQEQGITDSMNQAISLLTKYEMENTKAAIQYLETSSNETDLIDVLDHYPKTALVDIFERNDSNKVQCKEGIFQTHTVVLYEQEGKYLVVDPSNATFSTILIGVDPNIRVCYDPTCKIYKSKSGNTGPKFTQFRDCIDIAVKLAFSLTAHSTLLPIPPIIEVVEEPDSDFGLISPISLKGHPSISDITNNPAEMYDKLPNILTATPLRIKQSSDILADKKITAALKMLHSVKKPLDIKLKTIGFDNFKQIINQKIANLSSYDDIVMLADEITSFTDMTDKELLGMEDQAIDIVFGGFA